MYQIGWDAVQFYVCLGFTRISKECWYAIYEITFFYLLRWCL